MRFLKWTNKYVGDYDVFAVLDEAEKNCIVSHFDDHNAESVSMSNKYYYFINTKNKTITPMPMLSLAFSGQYNGYPPYGEELENYKLDISDFKLEFYKTKRI